MRIRPVLPCLAGLMALTACNTSVTGPAVPTAGAPADGYVHYATSGAVQCDTRPISVDGSRTRVVASGACAGVRVMGRHNDVIVPMAPGGIIEVIGTNNDVWWKPARPGGAPPVFRSLGANNSIHRDED